jgi:hypothetical protein
MTQANNPPFFLHRLAQSLARVGRPDRGGIGNAGLRIGAFEAPDSPPHSLPYLRWMHFVDPSRLLGASMTLPADLAHVLFLPSVAC